MQKRNDLDQTEEQDEELIIEQISKSSQLDDVELIKDGFIIELDAIERGLLLLSSIGSDEFSKYIIGSDFKTSLEDHLKWLESNLSQV